MLFLSPWCLITYFFVIRESCVVAYQYQPAKTWPTQSCSLVSWKERGESKDPVYCRICLIIDSCTRQHPAAPSKSSAHGPGCVWRNSTSTGSFLFATVEFHDGFDRGVVACRIPESHGLHKKTKAHLPRLSFLIY